MFLKTNLLRKGNVQIMAYNECIHIHYLNKNAINDLTFHLANIIPFHMKHLVFCAIGTDRCIGDAIGPLVGDTISADPYFPFPIYGTLKNPVHALNINETIQHIHIMHPNAYIIAIDACLGYDQQIGQVVLEKGPIYPGIAFEKKLNPIGDLSIKAIVNKKGPNQLQQLQSTRLHFVMELSKMISDAIINAYKINSLNHLHKKNDYSYYNKTWQ